MTMAATRHLMMIVRHAIFGFAAVLVLIGSPKVRFVQSDSQLRQGVDTWTP
jgi:hypothetical protein